MIRSRRVAATVDEKSDATAGEFASQSDLGVDCKGLICGGFRRNRFHGRLAAKGKRGVLRLVRLQLSRPSALIPKGEVVQFSKDCDPGRNCDCE